MEKLQHNYGYVVIQIDLEGKNKHHFQDGTVIELVRQVDNFNRRYTEPVNATVVSAEDIPEGAEVIIHHNSIHDTFRIFNYQPLSGNLEASSLRYYSIPENECFIYRESEEEPWKACKGFATGLRVFRPYTGIIEGILPTKIENVLYVTSGELIGKVVHTLKNCDYEMIFQDHGRENRLIRFRHWEDEELHEREEVIGVGLLFTEKVNCGEYYVGIEAADAKPLNEIK